MSELAMPVIIALPAEIDLTNASDVLELITAACAPGVPVVIADLTGTSFCDSSGLQHLIQASLQAAASGTELRLAISPGGAVSRIFELTGISQRRPSTPPPSSPPAAARRPARPAPASAMAIRKTLSAADEDVHLRHGDV